MKLTELEPRFLKFEATDPKVYAHTDSVSEADGVLFVCPKCFAAQGRPGSHSIICWRPRVPHEITPQPGRWEFEGTGYHDLTLVAGSSSVLLTGPGCGAHFFVRKGEIEMC